MKYTIRYLRNSDVWEMIIRETYIVHADSKADALAAFEKIKDAGFIRITSTVETES